MGLNFRNQKFDIQCKTALYFLILSCDSFRVTEVNEFSLEQIKMVEKSYMFPFFKKLKLYTNYFQGSTLNIHIIIYL